MIRMIRTAAFGLFLAALTFLPYNGNAQWEATNATSSGFDGIGDVESHAGILFSYANTPGFIQSTDNGDSWAPVGQSGFVTNPISVGVTHILSAGSALYAVTFNANYASSMVYVSTDNGATFTPDTAGLPKGPANGECVNVDRIYYHDGHLVADVANLGNYHKPVGSGTWARNNTPQVEWAELFGFYGGRYFTHAEYRNYISTDHGATWTQTADAGLPSWFTATLLAVNPINNRIYLAGRNIVSQDYSFLYSDDEGASWDSIAIHAYLGNNWLGGMQTIVSLFSSGDFMEITLDNDANNSHPDVLASSNGGLSFVVDTAGLPANSILGFGKSFAEHNGYLFMGLNATDVYRKTLEPVGLVEVESLLWNVYPNPASRQIAITGIPAKSWVAVADGMGKVIYRSQVQQTPFDLNVSQWAPGMYSVQVNNGSLRSMKRLIVLP